MLDDGGCEAKQNEMKTENAQKDGMTKTQRKRENNKETKAKSMRGTATTRF